MKHIVLYSGGLGSFFTARRLLERGIKKEDMVLLFTDTKIEDYDLYRFLKETSGLLEIPITDFSDGRSVWEVFHDWRFLGNSRIDTCSHVLKRTMTRKFIKQFAPDECIIYLGYDWKEINRFEKAQKAWIPYTLSCPLIEKPYMDREEMKKILELENIKIPRLYTLGFTHNNCGGGCVKAGIGHFLHLLKTLPEVYEKWETEEQKMRDYLNKDISILRRTRNGVRVNLTLRQLREEQETLTESEKNEFGGCNCFQS